MAQRSLALAPSEPHHRRRMACALYKYQDFTYPTRRCEWLVCWENGTCSFFRRATLGSIHIGNMRVSKGIVTIVFFAARNAHLYHDCTMQGDHDSYTWRVKDAGPIPSHFAPSKCETSHAALFTGYRCTTCPLGRRRLEDLARLCLGLTQNCKRGFRIALQTNHRRVIQGSNSHCSGNGSGVHCT